MTEKKPLLVLVDGSSYLFRAYFALPPLTNKKGMPTGAIYGVVNMLKKLILSQKPDYLGMIFDSKGPTFRHEFDPNYKANRASMPEELAVQIPYLHAIIKALGIPLISQEGVEADDVIGTLSAQASAEQWRVVISTGDKDMAQLVNEHVTLINTMNNKTLDVDGVNDKFGVRPDQIIDYLALMGDSSDNIPGIPKVGPKTAAKWLQEHGSMDAIIEKADSFSGKIGENLRGHLEQLPKNRFLTTIKQDLELPIDIHALVTQEADKATLAELYTECDFNRWRDEVGEVALNTSKPVLAPMPDEPLDDAGDPASMAFTHDIISNEESLKEYCNHLIHADTIGLQLETNDLESRNSACIGLALATDNHHGIYIPIAHESSDTMPKQLPLHIITQHINNALNKSKAIVIGQHLKYQFTIMAHHGFDMPKQYVDNQLAAYLLNKTNARLSLEFLCQHYLDHTPISFESIAGSGKKQLAFQAISINKAAPYVVEGALLSRQLYRVLTQQLKKENSLDKVFHDIDLPMLTVLMRMEEYGVLIDSKLLRAQSTQHEKRLEELYQEATALAGKGFNLSSPKQLREILFDSMGLPVIKKTPGGDPSTSEEVLRTLALNYPLPELIMEHRQLSKLKSTYTDKLPELADPTTQRIHTTYHQTSTSTGRLSSTSPNLQNIPIKTPLGRDIRRAFVAPEGYQILSADYSQVELRIMAHLSQDPNLLSAFEKGADIHRATASDIFSTPIEDVTSEQRRHAKAVNFGLLYGMSSFGLAKQLGISRSEAANYMNTYFERFPTVQSTLDRIRQDAAEYGYVETCFGRRVYLPGIHSKNAVVRKAAERAAINAPMQGSASDIIKLAMIAIDQWIQTEARDIKLIMQVHDELVFEVPTEKTEEASKMIQKHMMKESPLDVPLVVDVVIGDHWR